MTLSFDILLFFLVTDVLLLCGSASTTEPIFNHKVIINLTSQIMLSDDY